MAGTFNVIGFVPQTIESLGNAKLGTVHGAPALNPTCGLPASGLPLSAATVPVCNVFCAMFVALAAITALEAVYSISMQILLIPS
jgi:hypothetical protein